jgi:hypothetical protein
MRTAICIFVFALAFMASRVQSQDSQSNVDAENSAQHWLQLIDAGDFDKSWDAAAEIFQEHIAKSAWASAAANARSPLGEVISRKMKSARFARTLPGAPDGEYVVIQFETKFENKPNAIEIVTPARTKDGSWKVSGYFIR